MRQPRNLETSTVASMFPFNNGTLSMDRGMLYGLTPHEHSLTIIDPFDLSLPNGNMFICAMSGSGKSFFVKTMAVRNLLAGTHYIIVDPEDEYGRLCELVEGQYVRLALGSADTINPFDLPPTADRDEGWRNPVAEQIVTVLGLLQMMIAGEGDSGARLTPKERAVLERAIKETYARAGITGDNPRSWTRPAPLLDDLHAVLAEVRTDTPAGVIADDLAARLEPYVGDGALAGLFNRPTSVDLGRRFVVFNIQGLDESLHPLAIHTITGFVWRQVRWNTVRGHVRETMLVIDEAWSLLKHEKGGAFLEDNARRARKYGLAQVTITQKADDFLQNPHGNAVVSNAAITFLMRQKGNQIGIVGDVFGLTAQERTNLVGAPKGGGYLFLGDRHTWLQVEASPEEWRVASTSHRELEEFAAEEREGPRDGDRGARHAA
jgi:type IV secretory pathway VirB4 component